jgi:WD40 repeat protein
VLAAASDGVRLLDPTTGQALGDPLSAMDGWALAFSPLADRLLVTRTDGTFQLWDWRARRPLTDVRKAHDGAITEAAFSPDGRLLASAGHDGTLKVWDGATLRPAAEPFAGTGVELYAVAWNPAGNLLATAGLDGDVQLWDWTTRRSSSVLTGAEGETNAVAFPPGGRSPRSAPP